jgi:hypothetical protein
MSLMWHRGNGVPDPELPRGAAPVAVLAELPAVEMAAVLALRLWCSGAEGRARLAADLALALGAAAADADHGLSELIRLVVQGGRRPMMRHGIDCPCVGGDESAFAQMVAAAAGGDREDALIFALALMPPVAAFAACQQAGPVGLALLALVRRRPAPNDRQEFTRH